MEAPPKSNGERDILGAWANMPSGTLGAAW
jgi:hypothetical protein